MAFLLETARNTLMGTSKHGRRLYLTNKGMNGESAIAGFTGPVHPIEDVTSTAGTTLTNYGQTNFLTSGSTQTGVHTLQAIDVVGLRKIIGLFSTSTGNQIVKPNSATIWTCSGATASTCVNLRAPGAIVELMAISTSVWMQLNYTATARDCVSFSTST